MNFDVLIIGGGVIGLSLARSLLMRGCCVGLVDAGTIGRGASWAAAGMLTPSFERALEPTAQEMNLYEMFDTSFAAWPEFAQSVGDQSGDDLDYRDNGVLGVATNASQLGLLKVRHQILRAAGVPVQWLDQTEVQELEPGLSDTILAGLLVEREGQVDPRKLVTALGKVVGSLGGEVFENVEIVDLAPVTDSLWGAVSRDGDAFHAEKIIVTSAFGLNDIWHRLCPDGMPFYPVKGQALSVKVVPTENALSRVVRSEAGYLCPKAEGPRVIIGATMEPHIDTVETQDETINELQSEAGEILPALAGAPVFEKWSGLRPATPDFAPIMGPVLGHDGVFVSSGHYRHGILLAPAASMMMTALLLDGEYAENMHHFTFERFL